MWLTALVLLRLAIGQDTRCPDIVCENTVGASCISSVQPYQNHICQQPGLECSGPDVPPTNFTPGCLEDGLRCSAAVVGAPCSCDNDCINPDVSLYCDDSGASPSCQIQKLPGDYCSSKDDCPGGGVGACQSNRCAPNTLPGGICIFDTDCAADHYCNTAGVANGNLPKCLARPALGDSCNATVPCYFPYAACNLALSPPSCVATFSLKVGALAQQLPAGPPSICASGFAHNGTCGDFPQPTNPNAPCNLDIECTTNYKGPGPPVFGSCGCTTNPSNNFPRCSLFPTGEPQQVVAGPQVISTSTSLYQCAFAHKCWLDDVWSNLHTPGSCALTNCGEESSAYLCAYSFALYSTCETSASNYSTSYCTCQNTTQMVLDSCGGSIPTPSPSPSASLTPSVSLSPVILPSASASASASSSSLWDDYGIYMEVVGGTVGGLGLLACFYCCFFRKRPDITDSDEYWPAPGSGPDFTTAVNGSFKSADGEQGGMDIYDHSGEGPLLSVDDNDDYYASDSAQE